MSKKIPLSYIELSKSNLINNIKQFRNSIKKGTELSMAIKGNAYGHGQNLVAKILEPHVDYFQLNSIEELKLLRKITKKKTFILGYIKNSDLSHAIGLGCILAVFSLGQLRKINKIAQRFGIKQEIHIPVDAHLGREGFLLRELIQFLKEAKRCKYVKVSGIYAHFANIEDTTNLIHAHKQIREYERALKLAKEFGFENLRQSGTNLQTHISATSGILVYEKKQGIHPLVRLGIGAYGMWPSEHLKFLYKNKVKLKPVLSWKTKIAQVKILSKGNTVGYGLTYKTKKETKIAVIPQGYADGLDRGLSNKGEVLIGGTRCKMIGRISMNMFVVDVSHLNNVKAEDKVVIIGEQGGEEITAEEIAEKLDTINYEITTRISSLLPRILV